MTRRGSGMERVNGKNSSDAHEFTGRIRLLGNFEAIADAPQGLQILRVAGIGFYFFAQPADVYVDGTSSYEGSFFPNRVEKLIAREHAPAMGCQILQQPEFASSRKDAAPCNLHSHGRDVDVQITQVQDFAARTRLV